MLTEPLPTSLDVRKAAAREVSVSGLVALPKLHRLRAALASDEGRVEARCQFGRDEEGRPIARVAVTATLMIPCQRCLQGMPLEVRSENVLAIVASDDAARQIPASLDPWLVESEQGDLWAMVEDELILEIPVVAYHETDECKQLLDAYRQPPATPEDSGDNPFKVLEQLKPDSK